jgi:tetratricopeptide (TPR) repeat protein
VRVFSRQPSVFSRKSEIVSSPASLKTALVAAVVVALLLAAPATEAALTEAARLAAIYDTILAAKFDDASAQLKDVCPPAPEEACQTLAVVSLWWQIQLDPESHLLDGRFTELAEKSVAASEAWTRREPRRGEAWFYLAGSYAPLVQWRVLRGERVAAAREGNKIREALERALALDPSLNDAYFGIGLYHYYADVAPAAAKFLRWMLSLPGGDRAKGLQEMLTARDRGELLRGEADYQLHLIYLWYEHDTPQALRLLDALDRRYPSNPLFLQRIAEVESVYVHDEPASAAAWQKLIARTHSGEVEYQPRVAEVRARLGLATALDAMYETDRAIDELQTVIEMNPREPPGARARARLLLDRATAKMAIEPYRLSIMGWRALERGALDEAETMLSRAVALAPIDPVARYRYARLLQARGATARARDALEEILARRPLAPPIVLASTYVDYARLLEHSGDRARALAMYRNALDIVGGDPRAHDEALRATKRLAGSVARGTFF